MEQRTGAREIGLIVAALAVLAPFVTDAPLWTAAVLGVVAATAGTAYFLGETLPWRWPADRIVLPALAAFAAVGIARIVDPAPWLALEAVAVFSVTVWTVGLETAAAPGGEPGSVLADGSHPRAVAVRLTTFGLAFLAFTAIGGMVPASATSDDRTAELVYFLGTVALDMVVGALAGFRIVAVRPHERGELIVALYLYSLAIAPVGVLVRVLDLPRLFGPAILTLAIYLVTSLRESDTPLRRNVRLLQETAILVVAGVLVVVVGILAH